ncbi:MAG: sodium:proton antiporter [Oscillospiraceae bacterium]|nr:sodium:proton antiporter [Oscillospiraceae bacterium]
MEAYYHLLFVVALILLALGIFFALLRAIKGPRISDRIMGINLSGTMAIACLAILSIDLKESWLLDVSLIYGMISFLAVVVLAQIHIAGEGKEKDPDD